MSKYLLYLSVLLSLTHLYNSQAAQEPQKPAKSRMATALDGAENATSFAVKLMMQAIGQVTSRPRLTLLAVTVIPLAVPYTRSRIFRTTSYYTRTMMRHFGRLAKKTLHDWLFEPYEERLDQNAQQLEEHGHILIENTGAILNLHDAVDRVSEEVQKGDEALREELRCIQEIADENTGHLKIAIEQGSLIKETAARTNVRCETLEEMAKQQEIQLADIAEKVGISLEQLQELMGLSGEIKELATKQQQGTAAIDARLDTIKQGTAAIEARLNALTLRLDKLFALQIVQHKAPAKQ